MDANEQEELVFEVSTAPSVEPVTRAEAKLHLRVTHTDDDDYVDLCIQSAREYAEKKLNRAFITQTVKLYLQSFPSTGEIILPRPPVQSITSVKYDDTDNVQQTATKDTVWEEDLKSTPARAVLMYGQTWPAIRSNRNAIVVEYEAGYGDAETDVPEDVRRGLFMLIADYYAHRMSQAEMKLHHNEAVDRLLSQYDATELV